MNGDAIFGDVLTFTLKEEGGFTTTLGDGAGATNCGLTMADLCHWNREATVADLQAMPDDLIAALYRTLFWSPVRGWALWPGLGLSVFDTAVNCGIGTSAMQLQRLLGVKVDGAIGPITTLAANDVNAIARGRFLASLRDAQTAAYRGMTAFPKFGNGWLARTERRYLAAITALAKGP